MFIKLINGQLYKVNDSPIISRTILCKKIEKPIEKDFIRKIIKFNKNEFLFSTNENKIKCLQHKKNSIKFSISVLYDGIKDFNFYSNFALFALFKKKILCWKKVKDRNWKVFAKIYSKDNYDSIFILKKSKLMFTTSYGDDRLKLWSFLGEQILFCGKTSLKHNIGGIGIEKSSDCFAIGSFEGQIYLYNNNGMLISIMKSSRLAKKQLNKSNLFPITFFDENIIFSGGHGAQIVEWDSRVGKPVKFWNGHKTEIRNIVFPGRKDSCVDSYFYTSDNHGVVKKWDKRIQKECLSIKFPKDRNSTILLF